MKKMKDILLIILNYVLVLGAYLWIGFSIGRISVRTDDMGNSLFVLALLILLMLVWMLVHIILHEAGHMIAGLLTGYTFVSFRIGSLTIIKDDDGKLQCRKMKVQGTAGQCLMCPPQSGYEKCPYKLYHLGGGLINILLGGIGLILFLILPESTVSFALLGEMGAIGLILGISNLLPCKAGGIQNDGYNLFIDFRKNETARECIYYVLLINALLTKSKHYEDIPKEAVNELKRMDFEKMDITNTIIANAYTYQAAAYLAERNFETFYHIQKRILDTPGVIKIFKNEAQCECLFYEILRGADASVIDGLYDKKLQEYIKATAIYPSRKRLLYAYYHLYQKDEDKAMKEYHALEKLVDTYAVRAEADLEMNIAKRL